MELVELQPLRKHFMIKGARVESCPSLQGWAGRGLAGLRPERRQRLVNCGLASRFPAAPPS